MSSYIDLKKLYADAAISWPENPLYCLADHGGMPGLLDELKKHGVPYASLFEGSREARAMEVAPLLISLDLEARKQYSYFLQWLAEHGTYTSSILLLSSPLPLDELNRRLAQRLNARVSDDMDVMLRYFDPRTFEGLLTVLSEDQRDTFLSVADCWWYLDRCGVAVQRSAAYETKDRFEAPVVLTAEQEFALLDASEGDQVAAQLRTMMPDHYRRIPLPQQHDFITRQMLAAAASGIKTTSELALYCGLALIHGEGFAATSPWRSVLERVSSGAVSLSDAVANEEEDVENEA
jgi:hypothetical protein